MVFPCSATNIKVVVTFFVASNKPIKMIYHFKVSHEPCSAINSLCLQRLASLMWVEN